MYNQRSAYWDELQFVEDSMNLRNIGRYMNVNLRNNMVSKSGITFQSRCFFAFTQTYHIE